MESEEENKIEAKDKYYYKIQNSINHFNKIYKLKINDYIYDLSLSVLIHDIVNVKSDLDYYIKDGLKSYDSQKLLDDNGDDGSFIIIKMPPNKLIENPSRVNFFLKDVNIIKSQNFGYKSFFIIDLNDSHLRKLCQYVIDSGKEHKLIAILEYDNESKNKQIDICYLNPGIKDIPKHIEFNDKKIQIILDKNKINHLNDDIILLWDDLDDPLSPMIPVNASLVENQKNSFIIHGEIPENESSLWNLAFKTSDDLKLKSVIIEIYENVPELISSINEETIKI